MERSKKKEKIGRKKSGTMRESVGLNIFPWSVYHDSSLVRHVQWTCWLGTPCLHYERGRSEVRGRANLYKYTAGEANSYIHITNSIIGAR